MSSKFFGNSKVKGPLNDKNKKKIKTGGSMKSTTAIRKTGRGNQVLTPSKKVFFLSFVKYSQKWMYKTKEQFLFKSIILTFFKNIYQDFPKKK